jgi:hypothetical protein
MLVPSNLHITCSYIGGKDKEKWLKVGDVFEQDQHYFINLDTIFYIPDTIMCI